MNEKKSFNKKFFLFIILLIILCTIGTTQKEFPNDTLFNISIGKYIINNGIDMKEHFSWINGLSYTYSHWAFDIIVYKLFSIFNNLGLYIFLIIFTIITNIFLFVLLYKRSNNMFISGFVTIVSIFLLKEYFTVRSQIISFLCFIIEIYCIEKYIDTSKIKYGIIIVFLGIIVANFHAAAWPFILILFMPYFASSIISSFSNTKETYKIIRRENYNTKKLFILFLIVLLTGFLTPIHGVPYTYTLKSMLGPNNFAINEGKSLDYIMEMKPLVSLSSLPYIVFMIMFVSFLLFVPTKIKLEHGFLMLGLLLMALISNRYVALLILLGNFVLADLFAQTINKYFSSNEIEAIKTSKISLFATLLLLSCLFFAISFQIDNLSKDYLPEDLYPIGAVNYIKNNLDYKNIKIYNDYNEGSYLMFNNIPVFIDSRLDVYCSEFNNTDIFRDYTYILYNSKNYEKIFTKYNFTHILLNKKQYINEYLVNDSNYNILYKDKNFVLYERNILKNT